MVPRQDVTVRAHVNAVQIIDGRAGDEEAHGRVVHINAASGSSASAWCAVLLQGAGADERHGCVQRLSECLPQARESLPKGCRAACLLVSYWPLARLSGAGICHARLVLTPLARDRDTLVLLSKTKITRGAIAASDTPKTS